MGKGNELWDDSALIDAFDRAVASFKEAHFVSEKEKDENKDKEEFVPTNGNINISDRHIQDDNKATKEEIQAEEPINVNSYDQLLKQYYELEEKRQTILHQLYAHPSYYDQTLQVDAYNTTPQQAVQNPQCLHPLCVGYCLPVPVMPMTGGSNSCFSTCQICDKCSEKCPGCTVAVPCSPDLTKQCRDMDHSTETKNRMMLAESALRTIDANIIGEGETVGVNECLQGIGTSDPDLVPVLSAWYSAGFHTGRYLMEKSQEKNP